MDSPLFLEKYFFPVVNVTALPDPPEDRDASDIDFHISTSVAEHEDGDHYRVGVEITSPPKEDKENQHYLIYVVAIGIFRVDPEWPDPDKLLKINGASILYSAAREFLVTITSRGPYGQVFLPTVSFNRPDEQENRDPEQTEEQSEKE